MLTEDLERFFAVAADNFIDTIYSFNGEILISFNYGHYIQKDILDLFNFAYNFHGSILPNYAGPHSINWQIINGEKKSGVTIHELTPEIDGGNIVIQREFELLNEYTAQDVLDKNVDVASKLLPNLIKGIEQNSLSPIKQVKLGNEYICKLRKYEDGEILKGMSVKNIYDMARALADPWPGVFYFDKNEKIILNNKISMSKAEKIFKIINC